MIHIKRGLLGIILCIFITGPLLAGDILETFSHRDKFYDLEPWGTDIWLFGFPSQAVFSGDRGKTWKNSPFPGKDVLYSFSAFDDKTGILTGPKGRLFRTENRGNSWETVNSGTTNPLFESYVIPGTSKAWIVGHFNTILFSEDKGKTWARQIYTIPEDAEDEPGLNAVHMLNEQVGLIVGEFGVILKTEDGGKTWLSMPSPAKSPLYDVRMLDENRAVAVGSEGLVLQSEDGGRNWRRKDVGIDQHLFALDVVNGRLFAVGQEGYFLTGPIEGDGKWAARRTGIYTWLNAVHFFDEKNGLAAGGRGSLLRTADGGNNWTQLSGR